MLELKTGDIELRRLRPTEVRQKHPNNAQTLILLCTNNHVVKSNLTPKCYAWVDAADGVPSGDMLIFAGVSS